jgi:hypothetical protein
MNQYLFSGLEHGPIVIGRLMEKLHSQLDKPTGPDRFTPREVVAHLADWEPILLGRIRQCVEQPGSTLIAYDEGEMALEHDYAHSDPAAMAESYKAGRAKTVAYLRALPAEDWHKATVHPERGEMKVYEWAAALIGHDMYHIEQLSSVL